jgi:hypothetical protein
MFDLCPAPSKTTVIPSSINYTKGHFEVRGIAKQNTAFGFMLQVIKSAECLARLILLWLFLGEIGLRYYYCVLMKFLLLYFAHGNTLKKIDRRPGVMTEQ